MTRREFFGVLGGVAAAWPLLARAQQPAMPVVEFVYPGAPELSTGIVAAFRDRIAAAAEAIGRRSRLLKHLEKSKTKLLTWRIRSAAPPRTFIAKHAIAPHR